MDEKKRKNKFKKKSYNIFFLPSQAVRVSGDTSAVRAIIGSLNPRWRSSRVVSIPSREGMWMSLEQKRL
jgi:hypothetical protein